MTFSYFILGIVVLSVFFETAVSQLISTIRLRNGTNDFEGRVELLHNGEWGAICDDNFDVNDAIVICRMLGYGAPVEALGNSHFGPGGGKDFKYWIDELACSGNERDISECSFAGYGIHNCDVSHTEDASVRCTPPSLDDSGCVNGNKSTVVRLADGTDESNGRLEVFFNNGSWGTVCDDNFDENDAKVICRSLCYNPDNARVWFYSGIAEVSGVPILLDEVDCTGNEGALANCSHAPWGNHDCQHYEDVHIMCDPDVVRPTPVPSVDVEVTCDGSHIITIFNVTGVSYPIIIEVFNHSGCAAYQANSSLVTLTIPYLSCGTTKELNDTHIMYRNTVRQFYNTSSGGITRSEEHHIPVYCIHERAKSVQGAFQPEAQTVAVQSAQHNFDVSVRFFMNSSFDGDGIQVFPVVVTLGDWLSVSIRLSSIDEDLKIIVHDCFATTSPDKNSQPSYYLIENKCRSDPTVTFFPVNEATLNYRFQVFKFLGNSNSVYLHCEAVICERSEKSSQCDRSCGSRRRKRQAEFEDGIESVVLTRGPFMLRDPFNTNQVENSIEVGYTESIDVHSLPSSTTGRRADVMIAIPLVLLTIIILLGQRS